MPFDMKILFEIIMKKSIIIFIMVSVLLAVYQPIKSQEDIKGKMFYSELGGSGVIFSLNFDSRFKAGERLGWGFRAGFGSSVENFDWNVVFNTVGDDNEPKMRSYYTIPVGINYILGKKNSAKSFEIGAGTTFLTRKANLFYYNVKTPGHFIGHLNFMFRRVPLNGGLAFRVGFTPIIGTSGDIYPMGAVGFGYAF